LENNLDALLTSVVKDAARKRGVVYAEDRLALKVRQEFKGQYSGFEEAGTQVVTDAAMWQRLWQQCHQGQEPQPELPAVDFEREMVLVARLGQKPSGGYDITITHIAQTDKEVVVTVQERQPPKDAMLTMALTQPYHLLIVERTKLPVRFVTEK
jgi:hypothetical protein